MGKAEELLSRMGGSILESASHRGTPVAMPTAHAPHLAMRTDGPMRSKAAFEVALSKIERDPNQPREEFDPDALGRLVESIRTKGLLQPISVRRIDGGDRFMVVAGERRWKAATEAGLSTMTCIVFDRELPPGELLALQCVENLLREDLRPIEQAKAFRTLMDVNGWSGNQLAKELGISQPAVVAALKLLGLPGIVRDLVDSGALPASSASAIASLDDPGEQAEVAARVVAEGLSRAETVEAVRQSSSRASQVAKGRGGKVKPRKVTERVIRTAAGPRVTVEHRRGLDGPATQAALREALDLVNAELADDQNAA